MSDGGDERPLSCDGGGGLEMGVARCWSSLSLRGDGEAVPTFSSSSSASSSPPSSVV